MDDRHYTIELESGTFLLDGEELSGLSQSIRSDKCFQDVFGAKDF